MDEEGIFEHFGGLTGAELLGFCTQYPLKLQPLKGQKPLPQRLTPKLQTILPSPPTLQQPLTATLIQNPKQPNLLPNESILRSPEPLLPDSS